MTRSSRTPARIGAIVAVVGLFSLFGTMPASAHTGKLFTFSEGDTNAFATVDQATAAVTPLPLPVVDNFSVNAEEICNEQGYAVGTVDVPQEPGAGEIVSDGAIESPRAAFAAGPLVNGPAVVTWDHTTGATSAPVGLTQTFTEIAGDVAVYGLDTLADCTLIAYMSIDPDVEGDDIDFLVSIDPTTGVMTKLIDLSPRDGAAFLDSIATDPTTGITYGLVDEDDGLPEYLVFDIAAGTFSGPLPLTQIQTDLGDGWIQGADFDTAGTLWFFYAGEGNPLASTSGAFSGTVGAVTSGPADSVEAYALAYDPIPPVVKAELPNTGLPIVPVGLGGLGLLLAGVAVIFVTKRRATA